MIYTPTYESGKCVVIQNQNVVREYQEVPTYNSDVSYKDYYVNMDYNYNEGVAHFSNYSTLPVCRTGTNNTMYRIGITNSVLLIIIILFIMANVLMEYLRKLLK